MERSFPYLTSPLPQIIHVHRLIEPQVFQHDISCLPYYKQSPTKNHDLYWQVGCKYYPKSYVQSERWAQDGMMHTEINCTTVLLASVHPSVHPSIYLSIQDTNAHTNTHTHTNKHSHRERDKHKRAHTHTQHTHTRTHTNSFNSSRFMTTALCKKWSLKTVTIGLYGLYSIALKKDTAIKK